MTDISKWNGFDVGGSGSTSLGGCLVYLTSNESITSYNWDSIYWDAEEWDTDSYWSSTYTARIIFPATGRYLVHYNIKNVTGINAWQDYVAWLLRANVYDVSASSWLYPPSSRWNGLHYNFDGTWNTPWDYYRMECRTYYDVEVNDYIQFQTYAVPGSANPTLYGNSDWTSASWCRVERIS